MGIESAQDPESPTPIGPYSRATKAGGFVFVSGQVGIQAVTGKIVEGGIERETGQALENIGAILASEGLRMEDVVAVMVHMVRLSDFQAMNQVYATYFRKDPPARTTVGVTALPAGAAIEITATAYTGGKSSG